MKGDIIRVQNEGGLVRILVEKQEIKNSFEITQTIDIVKAFNGEKEAYSIWTSDKEIIFDHEFKKNYLTPNSIRKY
jgi:hypothetical protein